MLYNKRHALQSRLEIIICQLVSYKEGIDHHEGVIDVILSDPVEDIPQYALDNARRNLVYCRNGLERAEIEYYAVKKELTWYEFIDAETTKSYPDADLWHNAQSYQASIDNLELTLKINPLCVGYIPKLNSLKWLQFQECN